MDAVEIVKKIEANVEGIKADHAKINAELHTLAKTSGEDAKAALNASEEISKRISAQAEQIVDLERKLAEGVHKGNVAPETLGAAVIKSEAYKAYAAGNQPRMVFHANTIIGMEGSPLENSSTIVAPYRLPGIIPGAYRQLRIRDVLPTGIVSSNLVEYTRELTFTNNAAETAEGAQKPESALTFELVQAPVKTIATLLKVSKQVIADAPQLKSYVDTRLRYAVDYRLDAQLLNGDGNGQNISGMTDPGNYTAFTPVSGENGLDAINRAIYQVYASDYAPTAIIMNPQDWGVIERLKVGTGDARYIIGDPQNPIGPTLWGLPVVLSNAMTVGRFLVANFPIAYQFWNREGTVVEMFEQDSDNVQKNLVTIRAETRGALAVYRPAAARYGLLTA